jgi:hypothetical protein
MASKPISGDPGTPEPVHARRSADSPHGAIASIAERLAAVKVSVTE